MSEFELVTPVALFVFNRPDTTARVFKEIAKAKPPKLLLISDGPRLNRPDEVKLVEMVRNIINQVDWPCEILRNYSDTNIGPGVHGCVSSGLNWVFSQVSEAIILEDDTLPTPTFFRFCQELLERYREDERIATIGGANVTLGTMPVSDSYYFFKYTIPLWGWASWRRVWENQHQTMLLLQKFQNEGGFDLVHSNRRERMFWSVFYTNIQANRIRHPWDCQLALSNWMQGQLSICPAVNLISNIGFNSDGTNTQDPKHHFAAIPVVEMNFPLQHPSFFLPSVQTDATIAKSEFNPSIMRYLIWEIERNSKSKIILWLLSTARHLAQKIKLFFRK